MRPFRLFQRTERLFSREALYRSGLDRPFIRQPFFNLFIRHQHRSSARHLFLRRRPFSTKPEPRYNPTPNLRSPEPPLSLSQRFKKLSREYGWSALGVYFLLSALDFPLCFLAVRFIGPDIIGHYEHVVVEWVKRAIPFQWPEKWGGKGRLTARPVENMEDSVAGYDHGVREAELQNEGANASLWTQLALAYAIHKSFIFIRIPATVAVTPKVVKVLRSWGWNIGKRTPKAERLAVKAEKKAKKARG